MTQSHAGDVVVIGSISTDVSVVSETRPGPGETVLGLESMIALGGKGANQAVAAARAGARTHFIGCIGTDSFGSFVKSELTASGVIADELLERDAATGIAHIRIDNEGQNDIVVVPLANALLTPEDVEAALTRLSADARVLLTQLEIPTESCWHALRTAHRLGIMTVLDPAPALAVPDDVWPSVDIVTPNETEASRYTGIEVSDRDSAVRAGEWFVERGVDWALITLAERGAAIVSKNGASFVDSFPAQVVDTTAAGDTFAGYLGAALASGAGREEAVAQAMAAGAIAVTRAGASPSIPYAHEVTELRERHDR